ncbi:glutathione-S-transferase/glutaredoxin [Strigomonas culicis]|uniref:Glutathione-S-transferase/glutaredoxin n=1 Tax=Strigomonas culicis TaxID=28005 RepID=S9U013_9TRYP|nr:glutathione-S-transferase/glutaredoxin [Strigomonas culicis]EPY32084.1 glutathione-S-transferase/glutaredoxin [Strigomonas culicis]EPY32740.1 glutathione-S-transferase/glutaredoxin [Strigomonas culicis]EPY37195.1 glutathione-S-transferase/glutaredoxin [Strigomonas culicis]|eukprot:EPY22194.1 glutathione-S-transferase/glutaredoxin [Strigomonas culicis]
MVKNIGRKLFFGGAFLGVLGAGGGYATYQRRLRENRSISAEDYNAAQNQSDVQGALRLLRSGDAASATKLYRYTTCPWCGTVKAFLDCQKIRHDCVEVEPMLKGEINESAYKKVPQLRFDKADGTKGPYLVDSGIIVDTLAKEFGLGKQLDSEDVKKWRDWARGPLVRLMTLEFNKSLFDAWSGYSYIDKCDTIPYANKLFLKVVGAPVMYLVALNVTKPRLIRDGFLSVTDVPAERFHKELNRFAEEALHDAKTKKAKPFHGGNAPDLVDMDTFGVLQAVRGHRMYDELIAKTKISEWLRSMDSVVGNKPYTS